MDKKSIIGLVLICLVFVVFGIVNRPTKEQIAEQKRLQDSIAKVHAKANQSKSANQDNTLDADELSLDSLKVLSQGNDSIKQVLNNTIKEKYASFASSSISDEQKVVLENDVFKVDLSSKGGMVKQVSLKDYTIYGGKEQVKFFTQDGNSYGLHLSIGKTVVNTEDLHFKVFVNNKLYTSNEPIKVSGKDSVVVSFRLIPDKNDTLNISDQDYAKSAKQYIEYRYTLRGDDYRLGYKIAFNNMQDVLKGENSIEMQWDSRLKLKEKDKKIETQNSTIYYMLSEDVENLKEQGKDDSVSESSSIPIKWISYKQQFFSTILISKSNASNFNAATMVTSTDSAASCIRNMHSIMDLNYSPDKAYQEYDYDFFYGPNKYRIFKGYDLDLERTIPLGWGFFLMQWVNRFVIIPVFDFLQKFNLGMGLIILLLTLLVKLVLFPLAYKSFSSTAKMKVIQPEINKINEKYPKQDQAMQKQQATMQLYRRAGINPASGCLPMLLQFPILLAMFRFFPSSIELRQQHFLWADDLSTYDSILDFSFNIPLYGNHISLFCLLMTIAQLLYTRMTMNQQSQNNAMPGMKFMMYFMPIMMLFILNNLSAALNYYYLISLLISVLQMVIIKKTINEKKILDRLQQNSKKPMNKSKWQKRMEDLEKKNRQLMEERAKQQRRR
ncbi:MAG: membrane protein insertase YidC [Bacteroidales bacterium]|nr:membrane protein insertase YidC [Candidatus Scybalousia scybalohippi]